MTVDLSVSIDWEELLVLDLNRSLLLYYQELCMQTSDIYSCLNMLKMRAWRA